MHRVNITCINKRIPRTLRDLTVPGGGPCGSELTVQSITEIVSIVHGLPEAGLCTISSTSYCWY